MEVLQKMKKIPEIPENSKIPENSVAFFCELQKSHILAPYPWTW